jgi:predicted small lipoprotein YifL
MMRTLPSFPPSFAAAALALAFLLTACGNRTPLMLPKPEAKPPANAPAQSEAK